MSDSDSTYFKQKALLNFPFRTACLKPRHRSYNPSSPLDPEDRGYSPEITSGGTSGLWRDLSHPLDCLPQNSYRRDTSSLLTLWSVLLELQPHTRAPPCALHHCLLQPTRGLKATSPPDHEVQNKSSLFPVSVIVTDSGHANQLLPLPKTESNQKASTDQTFQQIKKSAIIN